MMIVAGFIAEHEVGTLPHHDLIEKNLPSRR
jgi:hypothetical protein